MRVQDHTVDTAKAAFEEAFRYAQAVPADKLGWAPLDNGRTVISMCQEMAMCPSWATQVIGPEPFGHNPEEHEAQGKEMGSWDTVEKCEEQFKNRFAEYAIAAKALTDEDLAKTKWLPFNGGRDHTYLELLEYVRWNCTYHLGQIAYIQTLYGDKEMH